MTKVWTNRPETCYNWHCPSPADNLSAGVFFTTLEVFHARKHLSSEGKPHRCKDRDHGRHHHLHDHGLHPCGQPQHSVRFRHGCKRCADCHLAGILCGHGPDGSAGQLPLCAGSRHGPERLLLLHGRPDHGLQLAAGSDGRLCGRHHLHRAVPDQCA